METNIKNSSGKITGVTIYQNNSFIIKNLNKPVLIIDDSTLVNNILNNINKEDTINKLYCDYTMSIGEIASLYNQCYSSINKIIKQAGIKTNRQGRRNRAYGTKVSPQQSKKMSAALKGRKAPYYERTPEIREKISKGLIAYYKEHPQNPEPHKKNWANGVYNNIDFHIGIGGNFTSLKNNNNIIHFRSLLELKFLLLLEQDESIKQYQFEPFHIPLPDGSSYLPDFLIEDNVIELKCKRYVERVKPEITKRFLYKKHNTEIYCKEHNLKYKIIYDEDLKFNSRKMKQYIKQHPEVVQKFNIEFHQPKRIYG